MRLTLGQHSYDLRWRALVLGALAPPEDLARHGADIVELTELDLDLPSAVPTCVTVFGDDPVRRALSAGAALLRLPSPTPTALSWCAGAQVAVIVPTGASAGARAAGLPPDRIVDESLLVDVVAAACPTAATAAGVIRGARIVRTADVAGARRVCDVLAAVLEAD